MGQEGWMEIYINQYVCVPIILKDGWMFVIALA
jgi:hypothetical protein